MVELLDESPEELYRLQEEFGWGDGLPVVAPTESRVSALLDRYEGAPDDVLAVLPPRSGACTARMAAVNAVMAGCLPAMFPVVVAAARALGRPEFNLRGVQATTHSVAVMVAVHGPIAEAAGYNSGFGAFGPGNRANATTGRAIRLILLNVGGGRPGDGDASTQGQPAKYSYCFAENASASPWPLYPRCLGIEAASAVTVAGVEGPHNIHDMWSTHPAPILRKVASVMTTLGSNNAVMADSEFFIVLGPEHAHQAANEDWSREDVQMFLHHHARLPRRVRDEHFGSTGIEPPWMRSVDDPDELLPMTGRPQDIRVMVAGGPGKHSCVIPGWGSISRSVTVPVDP